MALVGLILFQLGSCAYSLYTGDHSNYLISSPVWTGSQFVAMAAIFIVLSLWSYRRGRLVTTLARKLPTTRAMPSDTALLFNAAFLAVLAVTLRFGVAIPLIAIVSGTVGMGLSAVSGGLVGWVWGRRLFNPEVIFHSLLSVAAAWIAFEHCLHSTAGVGSRGAKLTKIAGRVSAAWSGCDGFA